MCLQVDEIKRNIKSFPEQKEANRTREWRRDSFKERYLPKVEFPHKLVSTKSDAIASMMSTAKDSFKLKNKPKNKGKVELNCGRNYGDSDEKLAEAEKCSIRRSKDCGRSMSKRRTVPKFEVLQLMNEVNWAKSCNKIIFQNERKLQLNGNHLMLYDSLLSRRNLLSLNYSNEINSLETTRKQSNLMTTKMKIAAHKPAASARAAINTCSERRRGRKRNLSSSEREEEAKKKRMMIKQLNSLKESSLITVFVMLIMFVIFTFAATTTTSVMATTLTSDSPKQTASFASKVAFKQTGRDQQPINLRRATNDEDQNQWIYPNKLSSSQQQSMKQSSESPLDHVSSADLPAEFRGIDDSGDDSDETTLVDNQGPKEQSKLAKLCEQTSSVLASVLPAPFGGHKRSILCQFFGQVPIKTPLSSQVNQQNVRPYQLKPPKNPYDSMDSIAVLHQAQQRPLTFHPNGKHPIQIVLEQQQRQNLAAQQSNLVNNVVQPIFTPFVPNVPIMRQLIPQEDLKSSASIVDYTYQQKLEPPAAATNSLRGKEESKLNKEKRSQIKYSTPITLSTSSTSFKPMQPSLNGQTLTSSTSKPQMLISTSGWRIFNQPPQEVTLQQSVTTKPNKSIEESVNLFKSEQKNIQAKEVPKNNNSTTIVQLATPFQQNINKTTTTSASSMISKDKNKQKETLKFGSAQLLVMGRPPGFDGSSLEANISSSLNKTFLSSAPSPIDITSQPKQTPSIGKRSEVLKSTTRANYTSSIPALATTPASDGVRIIEVIAQQSNSSSGPEETSGKGVSELQSDRSFLNRTSTSTTTTTTQKPITDLHQVQRREELVIASINNLTRIAFGNQLRDTVKVINKLIDQQADLFGKNINHRVEPLTTSESRQIVTGKKPLTSIEMLNGAKNDDKPTKQQVSPSLINSNQTGGSNYNGKQPNSFDDKSLRQKHPSSSQLQSVKPTKKPVKKQPSQPVSVIRSKSSISLPNHETKETIKPKSATFSSKKLTTSLPISTNQRGLLRSTQSRSSRNIDRISPTKSSISSSNSLAEVNKESSNSSDSSTKMIIPKRTSTTMSDLDSIVPTVTISDLHRDKSPWGFSPSPYIRDLTSPNTIRKSPTSTTLNVSYGNKLSDVKSRAATTLPWMLPESNYESNLFGTTISSMRKSTTGDTIKRWTSTRKYPAFSSLSRQPLVLNKLDKFEPKMDSLTTLKMSLTTEPPQIVKSSSISAQTSSSSQGGSTQSRWIPTSSISARPTQLTNSSTKSSSSTSSSTPPINTTPMPTTRMQFKEAISVEPTTMRSSSSSTQEPTINQNDLNEARASDSISKYTTHWNEANEILSTTRRFFQQPLPQIALTGEFFNAETISTWPERYQTMLNSNSEGKTTPSFETTRRNGETYERASTTNLARHKFDTTTTRVDPAFIIPNNSMSHSITILPSNHKLTTTTTTTFNEDQNNNNGASARQTTMPSHGEQYTSNGAQRDQTQPEPYTQDTNNEMMMTAETPTVPPLHVITEQDQKSLIPPPAVSYTLIGPYTNFKPEQKQERVVAVDRVKFPRILDDYLLLSDTSQHTKDDSIVLNRNNNGNSNSSFLKPPYLESHQRDKDHDIPTSNLSSLERHNVSRKLYELLIPSTKNFVGPQNPLNLQRFNLSALKFLAQNILMPNKSQRDSNSTTSDRGPNENGEEVFDGDDSIKSQEQLLDLFNSTSPMNYYDLLANESSQVNYSRAERGKSILGRAGNLLNDLKQMESKRAAALLAAIRYQVPGPLVRPWDTTSDHSNGMLSNLYLNSNSNERLDGMYIGKRVNDDELESSVSLRDNLLLAQLSNSIKSALFKQRIIPKNELEAKLKLHNHNPDVLDEDLEITLDRRSDSQAKPSKIDPYSFDENLDFRNESKSSAEYLYDKFPLKNGRNFTKNLINTLLNSSSSLKIPSPFIMRNNNNTSSTNYNYLDPIDFSAVQYEQKQDEDNRHDQSQYPKYIRLTDNKAAWSLNTEGSLKKATSRQPSLPSSAVAAKLRDNSSRNRHMVVGADSSDNTKLVQEVENKVKAKPREFDCDGKQAGFYPDIDTACQTFYHCSNTGHLLTFNCPQQTRFDEKSLKCGPWFEVPCDLGRLKSIR